MVNFYPEAITPGCQTALTYLQQQLWADAEQQPMPRMLWKNVPWTDVVKYSKAGAKWLTRYLREKYQ